MIIWVTWHRESYFSNKKNIKEKLYKELDKLDKKDLSFNLGWANWIDNWIWLWCINNFIPYNLYLPYRDITKQSWKWKDSQKWEFSLVIKNCSKIIYWKWYFHRNRLIVDNSNLIFTAFLNIEKSWTWYTLKYAKKMKKPIFNIL